MCGTQLYSAQDKSNARTDLPTFDGCVEKMVVAGVDFYNMKRRVPLGCAKCSVTLCAAIFIERSIKCRSSSTTGEASP